MSLAAMVAFYWAANRRNILLLFSLFISVDEKCLDIGS